MDKSELESLLDKYQRGETTPEENKIVEDLYEGYDTREEQPLSPSRQTIMYESLMQRIGEESGSGENIWKGRKRMAIQTVAAAIVLVIGSVVYFNLVIKNKTPDPTATVQSPAAKDLQPASQKATLTLGDGTVIGLDDSKQGLVASQGNVKLIKTVHGRLDYQMDKKESRIVLYNEVRTPRGGAYQVVLPDGSHVWLNASSSIRFPTEFASQERNIELTGEAYFEIAHNPAKPFHVNVHSANPGVKDCKIEVLGTHFNVMAYADETMMNTSLLEGSVKISGEGFSKILKPGQQAVVKSDFSSASIRIADVEEAVAWKNNLFWFNNADIHSVMRQISRWYDVDISYEGNVTKVFRGSVPRDLTASKLFDILERTGGVHFKISGKKVIVMP